MTHYKMNRLHLGGGESLSTFYRRSESVEQQVEYQSSGKKNSLKKNKPMRPERES